MTKESNRRQFLGALGTGAITSLAGCADKLDGNENQARTEATNETYSDGSNQMNDESNEDCHESSIDTGYSQTLNINDTEYEIDNIAVNDNGAVVRFSGELESMDEGDEIYLSGERMELEQIYNEEGNNGTVILEYGEDC